MKGPFHKRYTVDNNINATNNILCAIVESGLDIHLVHLGTTGVYGYSSVGMTIPEGYLNVKVDVEGREEEMEIPYPPQPGSIYHMTKTMDALMFAYYNKNDSLRITDLHQGIVWGTETNETCLDEALVNRFDYDGDYGTGTQPFRHAGSGRSSLDCTRYRWTDPCLHPYQGHRSVRQTGH